MDIFSQGQAPSQIQLLALGVWGRVKQILLPNNLPKPGWRDYIHHRRQP